MHVCPLNVFEHIRQAYYQRVRNDYPSVALISPIEG